MALRFETNIQILFFKTYKFLKSWKNIPLSCLSRLTNSFVWIPPIRVPPNAHQLSEQFEEAFEARPRDNRAWRVADIGRAGLGAIHSPGTHILFGVLENENIAHLSFLSPNISLPVLFLLSCTSPPKKSFYLLQIFSSFSSLAPNFSLQFQLADFLSLCFWDERSCTFV